MMGYYPAMAGLFDGTPLERPMTCAICGKSRDQCKCPRSADGRVLLPSHQPARVSRERRGGGKMVTIISGIDARAADLSAMLKEFKGKFGAGGSIVDGCIELQGDHRDKLVEILRERGYPAKPSGG
jgi:translation initiation factor 1